MKRSFLTSVSPLNTFRVYCTVNPEAPEDCTALVVPGGSAEFSVRIVRGGVTAYGSPVVVSTRRPSLRE